MVMPRDYTTYEDLDSALVFDFCKDAWRNLDAEYIALDYQARSEEEHQMWIDASIRIRDQFYSQTMNSIEDYIEAMKQWDEERERILAAIEAGDTDIRPLL